MSVTKLACKCGCVQVPENGVKYFWNLNVGNAVANTQYYFDDITLTSEPNAQYDNWMASAPVGTMHLLHIRSMVCFGFVALSRQVSESKLEQVTKENAEAWDVLRRVWLCYCGAVMDCFRMYVGSVFLELPDDILRYDL